MTRLDALKALLAKVEADGFDRWSTANMPFSAPEKSFIQRAYNGSLDAAKALHEAVLPGWWCELRLSTRPMACVGYVASPSIGHADTPARAWLIAILRALISQEESNE